MPKFSAFEFILLIIGIGVAVLGFQLINQVYISDGTLSWLMIISIFTWLILLVLFISLSLTVDISRKELDELRRLINILEKKKR